jgi:hypothetical protein
MFIQHIILSDTARGGVHQIQYLSVRLLWTCWSPLCPFEMTWKPSVSRYVSCPSTHAWGAKKSDKLRRSRNFPSKKGGQVNTRNKIEECHWICWETTVDSACVIPRGGALNEHSYAIMWSKNEAGRGRMNLEVHWFWVSSKFSLEASFPLLWWKETHDQYQ